MLSTRLYLPLAAAHGAFLQPRAAGMEPPPHRRCAAG